MAHGKARFGLVLLLVLVSGCAYYPTGLAPSSGPLPALDEVTVLGHAEGQVSYFSLLGIIPFGKPDYNRAIKDAISQYEGGKKLINVRSTFTVTWVVVGFIHKLKVEGDVVKY